MRVRGKNVAVQQFVTATKSKGGLILPDSTQKPLPQGQVCFVGPDIDDLKPGDVVCFTEFAGALVQVEDDTYRILESDEVLMVLDAKEE